MSLKGVLITNAGLIGPKFDLLSSTLLHAAEKAGVEMSHYDNISARRLISDPNVDFVLFWDKDISLARTLEAKGLRLFNPASAIEKCDSKAYTYISLINSGIRMPETIISPLVFYGHDRYNDEFLLEAEQTLGYPMVLKESFGSFGFQVYLVHDRAELTEMIKSMGEKPFILQKYISFSHGRDIRIEVIGGKPVAAMMRYSHTDFRANITSGGSMKPYIPTPDECEAAVKACEILGLDFAGVDLLFGEDGRPYLCEVNSNAHINNISSCTGVDVAGKIFEHIKSVL